MKKRNRFTAAALAALLLAGSAPSALALDATPPMYQQFGYDSAEEYMEQESSYGVFDYDTLSDHYRQHLDAVRSNPTLAVEYWGYDDLEGLSFGWDGDLEECYRDTARAMIEGDEYKLRCQLSVQLNGAYVHFADAQPEKVNGRVMVPFRAIAPRSHMTPEQSPRKRAAKRCRSRSAASSLPSRTARAKPSKPCSLIPRRTKKADAPMFRCAFLPKRSALPCSGIRICRPPCCMTARRL